MSSLLSRIVTSTGWGIHLKYTVFPLWDIWSHQTLSFVAARGPRLLNWNRLLGIGEHVGI